MMARLRGLAGRVRLKIDPGMWGCLIALIPWVAILLVVWLLAGCVSGPALLEELAKDPASNCVVLSTPYGGILVARATPGVRVNIAGGTCSIEQAAPR